MRVLFISGELIAGDIAYRLKQEGCEVKLYIEDKSRKDCLEGMVEKTDDWKKELEWVGKDGLIVFDDVGYGKIQDDLRKDGYNVFGGCEEGDRLEKDREFGEKIFRDYGIKTLDTFNFDSIKSAVSYIKSHKGAWVVKQNGHESAFNYVGMMDDGSDSISMLESYDKHLGEDMLISLQKKVYGIEIGVARYFNGKDWVGPVEINIEHKALFNGGIGPQTGEMGTIIWYENNEENRLFQATLAKLKPFLEKINFKGDIDINCIVNRKDFYPLEATARLGCPSAHLQAEIHSSPWKDFLMAVAKGDKYNLKYKKGHGIVVSVSIPPFPYKAISDKFYSKDAKILFKKKLSDKERRRIHFEEVSLKEEGGKKHYFIAGNNGYIIYITGFGNTVQKARKQAYELIDEIVIPKMFYRTDIGAGFLQADEELLKKWGWI
ncbi:MAG: phosphoribosylglycinamide synthetase C domain-containing protein [Candidatus Pacebacteria bacterium]|nr:phosphoribosylglycinamide synthetase C domain-containing protein [Candidatus Paceibacterota bacterium]